jgi:hypothetical protein
MIRAWEDCGGDVAGRGDDHRDGQQDQDPRDLRPLVRAEDVAEVIDVTSRTVFLMAGRGELPCVRLRWKNARATPQVSGVR